MTREEGATRRDVLRGAAGLLTVGTLAGCLGTADDTENVSGDESSPSGDSSETEEMLVQARVTYGGDWSGNVSTGTASTSIQGPGTVTATIEGYPEYVSVVAQKNDGGYGALTVEVLIDRESVGSQETTADYGVAQLSVPVYGY